MGGGAGSRQTHSEVSIPLGLHLRLVTKAKEARDWRRKSGNPEGRLNTTGAIFGGHGGGTYTTGVKFGGPGRGRITTGTNIGGPGTGQITTGANVVSPGGGQNAASGRALKMLHFESSQPEGRAPYPVHLGVLLRWLRRYPRSAEAAYLAQGFKQGICIPYKGQRVHVMSRNRKCIL